VVNALLVPENSTVEKIVIMPAGGAQLNFVII
jgi:hypothetical protein